VRDFRSLTSAPITADVARCTIRWRVALRSVALTIAALLCAACASTPEPVSDIPRVAAASITNVVNDRDIRLPLEAYDLTPTQFVVYENARNRASAACMRRKGFTYELPPRPTRGLQPVNHRRYGLPDVEQARVYGYQAPQDEAEANAIQRAEEISRALSREAIQALTGGTRSEPVNVNEPYPTVGTGCLGEAIGQLGAEKLQLDRAFVEDLQGESYDSSLADPRVQRVHRAWSACMAEAGFKYKTPLDGNNDEWSRPELPPGVFVDRPKPLPAGSRELIVATTDAECNRKVNVAGIWMAVEAAYQEKAIEKHQEELARIEADLAELLRKLGLAPQTTGA
jgi:hypothetical protein